MGLVDHIQGQRIYFDTNIFIYIIENISPYVSVLYPLLELIDRGEYHVITSELALAESLVKPFELQNDFIQNTYIQSLQNSDFLTMVPISRSILIDAAHIRTLYSIKLPDAIHIATALQEDCSTFISNDLQIKSINNLKVLTLKDYVDTD